MRYREFRIIASSRAGATALAVVALAAGAMLLVLGLTLLLAIAAVGTVVGAGVLLYRRLTGRRGALERRRHLLDPAMEVFPERGRELPREGTLRHE